MDAPSSGYQLRPHTADVIVEAWGPTRAACLRQAVRGLVGTFADVDGVKPAATVRLGFPPDGGEELLVALLEEVLYLLDTDDAVPVDATITEAGDGGLHGEFLVAPASDVHPVGAVPKAITRHGLELGERDGRWRCRVTVDV